MKLKHIIKKTYVMYVIIFFIIIVNIGIKLLLGCYHAIQKLKKSSSS